LANSYFSKDLGSFVFQDFLTPKMMVIQPFKIFLAICYSTRLNIPEDLILKIQRIDKITLLAKCRLKYISLVLEFGETK